nr:acyl carrier protein [Thalassoglobus neptunius]
MKESEVEDKIISIVSEQLSVSKDEISRESNFIDDLQADSLDLVELGMKFEEEFGVSIPDEDYETMKTVGDAIDYIKQRENA